MIRERPTIECPRCFRAEDDYDGFGFSFCVGCGYCAHDSITGDTCDACGREIEVVPLSSGLVYVREARP